MRVLSLRRVFSHKVFNEGVLQGSKLDLGSLESSLRGSVNLKKRNGSERERWSSARLGLERRESNGVL